MVSLAAREEVPRHPPASAVLAWAYLAVFGSLVAYSAYTYLLANTRASVATSYSYVNPAIAVAIGVVMGGERAGPEVLLAVGLIIAATVLVMRKPAPRLETAERVSEG